MFTRIEIDPRLTLCLCLPAWLDDTGIVAVQAALPARVRLSFNEGFMPLEISHEMSDLVIEVRRRPDDDVLAAIEAAHVLLPAALASGESKPIVLSMRCTATHQARVQATRWTLRRSKISSSHGMNEAAQ